MGPRMLTDLSFWICFCSGPCGFAELSRFDHGHLSYTETNGVLASLQFRRHTLRVHYPLSLLLFSISVGILVKVRGKFGVKLLEEIEIDGICALVSRAPMSFLTSARISWLLRALCPFRSIKLDRFLTQNNSIWSFDQRAISGTGTTMRSQECLKRAIGR